MSENIENTNVEAVKNAKAKKEFQTVKFEFYQVDKKGVESSFPNEFEVTNEADVRSIAYFLLRPISVMYQRKIELDAEYAKIKGNTKKAKLLFSLSKPIYFRLHYKGKSINTATIKDSGNVNYFSNIKISGTNPMHSAHVALTQALKVVFETSALNTETKIKTHFTATDSIANGMIETRKAAQAILKAKADKPKGDAKGKRPRKKATVK